MPKRRVSAKQVAASRRNLIKARAARKKIPRSRYGGKLVDLYHFTKPDRAASIMDSGGFNDKISSTQFLRRKIGGEYPTFFWTKPNPDPMQSAGFGKSVLAVRVPRRKAHRDFDYPPGMAVYVRQKDLAGRKVRRVR